MSFSSRFSFRFGFRCSVNLGFLGSPLATPMSVGADGFLSTNCFSLAGETQIGFDRIIADRTINQSLRTHVRVLGGAKSSSQRKL